MGARCAHFPGACHASRRPPLPRRHGDIGWTHIIFEPGDTLELANLGLTLPLADLYQGTNVLSG